LLHLGERQLGAGIAEVGAGDAAAAVHHVTLRAAAGAEEERLPRVGIARRQALAGWCHTRPHECHNLRKFRFGQRECRHARVGNAVVDEAAHRVIRMKPLAVHAADGGERARRPCRPRHGQPPHSASKRRRPTASESAPPVKTIVPKFSGT
jgi:hypothetical protein